jgi:aminoglycoside phosphotransferase (APT) family kinase protein
MSTIGHPLTDIINLLNPYYLRDQPREQSFYDLTKFKPGVVPGLPTEHELLKWYGEIAGWDATQDIPWGLAFHSFRSAGIYQGIAARYAVRQASSEKAKENGRLRHPMAELAWKRFEKARSLANDKAKL